MKVEGYCCILLIVFNTAVPPVKLLNEDESNFFGNVLEPLKDLFNQESQTEDSNHTEANPTHTKFSVRSPGPPHEDECYIEAGNAASLHKCRFNATSRTFLVIHGWTVSGMLASWISKLVSALFEREPDANVIVVDWLSRAHNHYFTSAQDTELVGQDVARLIDWIMDKTGVSAENLHLIGYSLGAHVAGFAGSNTSRKVGRITGLDPAGPVFEGAHADRRLSPDDAHFVDVVHTFTRASLGLSIGIQRPVGHLDVYPNGGTSQPGCDLRRALEVVAQFSLADWPSAMSVAVQCEHERSVHLFIDSLLNGDTVGQAYRCGTSDMFDRGICLSCNKGRCSRVGYDARRVRHARDHRMFTRTRSSMPFRVYHYQLKIHFSCKRTCPELEPSVMVSVYGTNGDAENLQLHVTGKIMANRTHSFLLVTEEDLGDLLMMTFKLEETGGWSTSSLMKMVSSWWSGDDANSSHIMVRKIRVKAGETQKKLVFCMKDTQPLNLAKEVTFVKCEDGWKASSRRRRIRRD
uniref:triacylglycerol lipase n=1 Tax=Paramormyrops kingsleyae TaxID=1676925 RepID=A0A3B3R2K6_9TELE|nr:lipoprotein lipase-like isoform X1 [Paramormyrops kingsleyae]